MASMLDIYNDLITSLLIWQVEVFSAWYESNLSGDIKMSKMYVVENPFVLCLKKRANYLETQGIFIHPFQRNILLLLHTCWIILKERVYLPCCMGFLNGTRYSTVHYSYCENRLDKPVENGYVPRRIWRQLLGGKMWGKKCREFL